MSDNKIQLSGIFSEGYGFVPKKLMKAKDIKSTTKLLLCYLLSYTGAGMECFPSIDLITNDLGISKRTVISCIKEAITNEYISKRQIQRGRGIGKQNIYNLIFMKTFPNNASANIAHANDTDVSAKNDTLQVQNSTSNNNSINNNNFKSNMRSIYLEWEKCFQVAENGGEGLKSLNKTTIVALRVAGGMSKLRGSNSFETNQMKNKFINYLKG